MNKNNVVFNSMLLIVGLGNKEKRFQLTRHNVGSDIIKKFIKKSFDDSLKLDKKLNCWFYQNNHTIYIIPYCFMNESGEIIKKIVTKFNVSLNDILIVHDDTDLIIGKFKLQKNRGSAGHKGIESIIKAFSSKNFWRLRIGVRPNNLKSKALNLVLEKFSKEEQKILSDNWKKIENIIKNWVKNH